MFDGAMNSSDAKHFLCFLSETRSFPYHPTRSNMCQAKKYKNRNSETQSNRIRHHTLMQCRTGINNVENHNIKLVYEE